MIEDIIYKFLNILLNLSKFITTNFIFLNCLNLLYISVFYSNPLQVNIS